VEVHLVFAVDMAVSVHILEDNEVSEVVPWDRPCLIDCFSIIVKYINPFSRDCVYPGIERNIKYVGIDFGPGKGSCQSL
jgi:hypothetical protein